MYVNDPFLMNIVVHFSSKRNH